jgi:hypothetical protein
VFSVGGAPRLYNDVKRMRVESRESLEMTVEDDGIEETVCHVVFLNVVTSTQ